MSLRIRILPLALLGLLLLAGCEPRPNTPSLGDDDDAADDAGDEDFVDTMDEYLFVYCAEYAVECDLYGDVDTCIEAFSGLQACDVIDADALNTCADWLSGLSCDETGWIDECDVAFECD